MEQPPGQGDEFPMSGGGGPSTQTTQQFAPWLTSTMPLLAGQTTNMAFGGGLPVAPSPTPLSQVAPLSTMQQMGYGQIQGMGATNPLINAASQQQLSELYGTSPYLSALSSTMGNTAPAASQELSTIYGASPYLNQQLGTLAGQAPGLANQIGTAQGTGAASAQQAGQIGGAGTANAEQAATISGANLYPGSNPMLESYFNAAAQPMVNQYQLATAPSLAASAAQTGTTGSTGAQQQQWANQYGLGQNLQNLAANIYEPAYMQGQQLQQGAAQNAQALANQAAQYGLGLGQGASQYLGNLAQSTGQFGLTQQQSDVLNALSQGQGAGEFGLNLAQGAAQASPYLAQSQYMPAQQLIQAGGDIQNQLQNVLNTATQNLTQQGMWPYQLMQNTITGLGGTNLGSFGTTTTEPFSLLGSITGK